MATRTLTGTIIKPNGSAAAGTVEIEPTGTMPADELGILIPLVQAFTLDGSGSITGEIVAGCEYLFRVKVPNRGYPILEFKAPVSADSTDPVDLEDLYLTATVDTPVGMTIGDAIAAALAAASREVVLATWTFGLSTNGQTAYDIEEGWSVVHPFPPLTPGNLSRVVLTVLDTAPEGGDAVFDVLKNGVSLFEEEDRPTLEAEAMSGEAVTADFISTPYVPGDRFTGVVITKGATVAGKAIIMRLLATQGVI